MENFAFHPFADDSCISGRPKPYWELRGGQNKRTPKNSSHSASRLMILLKNKNEQVLVKGTISPDWIFQ